MTAYDRRCQKHADAAASALDKIAAIRRAEQERLTNMATKVAA
jgi:hypothetical protein